MENPSAESIKKRVEDLSGIVDWVSEIWHGKNWVRRLLLLDVLFFIAFNPYFPTVLKLIPDSFIPNRYDRYFWAVVGLFFVIALIIGIRAKAVRPAPPAPDKRSPIKGLLAFDTADEEVFARLQRHNELLECAQSITDHNFRFGILSADSGNGKTSFLQAGLSPALRKRDHRCVYVKFAELDPVVSIRQALSDRLPPDTPPEATLSELLHSAARSEDKEVGPFVLLLDQFEQFFVHQKRKYDRALRGSGLRRTDHNSSPHERATLGGQRITPLEEYRRLYTTRYEISAETLALLLMKPAQRTIEKNGVNCFRPDWNYYHEAMADFKGCKVEVRYTDGDYSRVWVVLPDKKLCEATLITPTSILNPNKATLQAVAVARAHERQVIRDYQLITQSRLRSETAEDRVAQLVNPDVAGEGDEGAQNAGAMESQAAPAKVHRLTRLDRKKFREIPSRPQVDPEEIGRLETDWSIFCQAAVAPVREFDYDE